MANPDTPGQRHGDRPVSGDGGDRHADPQAARKKAMDYLARREYGAYELRRRLTDAGFREEAADAAVERLAAEGLQDDRRFAEAFVRSRVGRGKGPLRIRADLAGRGIDDSLIDAALEAAGEDWGALAQSARRKRFGSSLPGSFAEKARQMRFLERRGFPTEHIRAALRNDGEGSA